MSVRSAWFFTYNPAATVEADTAMSIHSSSPRSGGGSNASPSWDDHWAALEEPRSLFGRLASLVRRQILSRAVAHYAARYFREPGVYVECGCGTAQSSSRLPTNGRTLVALDFSVPALRAARRVPIFSGSLQGDIRSLPFRDGTVAGIWNLGVLEHFDRPAGVEILREFRRVLRPGGIAVLFWPPEFGLSRLVLAPIEWVRTVALGRRSRFFPDEVHRLRSRRNAREVLSDAGLEPVKVDFTPRDAFIHLVVVGRKPR